MVETPRTLTGANRTRVLAADFQYTPSGTSIWKWMFRFRAEPNHRNKVTAPVAAHALITVSVAALARVRSAWRIR